MLRILGAVLAWIPAPWLRALGASLGALVFSVLRVRRRTTLDNLRRALHLPAPAARRLARHIYGHLATGALEFPRLRRLTADAARDLLGDEGLARLRAIQAEGRGVLVLSAHMGQWDLLACAAALAGLKVNVVTREIKNARLNRFWMAERSACGVNLLPARGSARAVVAALRRKEVVALLLDQHEPGGVVVPFLGRPAATSTALARLARATGAPVVPVFLLRTARGGFRLEVGAPLHVKSSPNCIFEHTLLFTRVIEQQVRAHPDQWLWLHRRWKVPEEPLRERAR